MNSKNLKKVLSTSIASLTVLSTLSGSVSTKIYATKESHTIELVYNDRNIVIKFDDEFAKKDSYSDFYDGFNELATPFKKAAIEGDNIEIIFRDKDADNTEFIPSKEDKDDEKQKKATAFKAWLETAIGKAAEESSKTTDASNSTSSNPGTENVKGLPSEVKLTDEIEKAETMFENSKKELEEAEEKVKAAEEIIAKQEKEVKAASEDLESLKTKSEEAKKAVASKQTEIDAANEDQKKSKQEELKELQNNVTAAEKDVTNKQTEINEANEKLTALKNETENMKKAIAERREKLDEAKKELEELKATKEDNGEGLEKLSLFAKVRNAIGEIFKKIKNWFTSTFNAIKKFFSKNN